MSQSAKTVAIWFVLMAFFVAMWAAMGGHRYPLTGAKLAWVAGATVAMSLLLVPLVPVRRAAIVVATFNLIIGGGAGVCHALYVAEASWRLATAPVVLGGLLGLFLAVVKARARRREAGIARLRKERSREAADAVIAEAGTNRRHLNAAAIALMGSNFAGDAVRILGELKGFDDGERLAISCNLATALMIVGDLDTAGRVLDGAPAATRTWHADFVQLLRARILAQSGRADEALAMIDAVPVRAGLPADVSKGLRTKAEVARAHALATRADQEPARAILRRLDRADLEIVAESGGPAAPVAHQLLADTATPFR